ncbi:hypothetical protein [Ligilactobacillus salivarius]|uniref:Uncharacterized protein n=1 Tax=Ligilactobacillus salivarius TaxID=1624 RepID=A0A089RYZ1_9LACO|nr:hypothetical protein [Ligilactobacillus salivarius]AIR11667.1 Hypothetical protein LSJ_3047 [Ligilactobacillus salivarius]
MTKPYRWYKGEPVIMKRVYYIGNQMFTRLEHFYTKKVIPAVDVHEVKDTREESLEIASDLQEEPKQEEQTQVNKIKFTDTDGNESVFEENSEEYQKFVDDNKLKDEFIGRVLDGKINKHKGFNIERV